MTSGMTTTNTEASAQPRAADTREQSPRLTVAHLFGFLLGRRDAILAAARSRSTFVVGLLFVFAAALAREYDGEDLRREPWHLLIPLGASLALSFVLFLLVRTRRNAGRTFWREYRSFLGLFWLTAPLGLLYGVPYERFLSPVGAVQANLLTLAVVATWRVVLMTRAVAVFTGRSATTSCFLVMLVADAVAAIAMVTVPVPTLQVMGGIRLTEAEALLQNIAFMAGAAAFLTAPFWLVGAAVTWFKPVEKPPDISSRITGPASKGGLALAVATIALWFPVIPFTQREQRLRSDAERLLRRGDISTAIAAMSRHERHDYPPAWDPPPRIGWPEPQQPPVMDVVAVLAKQPAAPWVRAAYIDKFERRWLYSRMHWTEDNFARLVALIGALPEGPELKRKYADLIGDVAAAMQPTTGPATAAAPTPPTPPTAPTAPTGPTTQSGAP